MPFVGEEKGSPTRGVNLDRVAREFGEPVEALAHITGCEGDVDFELAVEGEHDDRSGEDFEKLGAFYLGKRYDAEAGALTDELVLYDSKDLTTHAVIIGMTGSGKTGLGIGILEEAALDHIPVIAIDPKGDMGNLLLTFPKLAASDFQPWVNPRAATEEGQTQEEFAASQAAPPKGQAGNSVYFKRTRAALVGTAQILPPLPE